MLSIEFTVNVSPVGKGRPKFRRLGNFVTTYTPKKTALQEDEIAKVAKGTMGDRKPLETPLNVSITFCMPVPQSYSKKRTQECLDGVEKHTKKPDLDNLAKLTLDSLNEIIYKDDSQIVSLRLRKRYSLIPAIEIRVTEELE